MTDVVSEYDVMEEMVREMRCLVCVSCSKLFDSMEAGCSVTRNSGTFGTCRKCMTKKGAKP